MHKLQMPQPMLVSHSLDVKRGQYPVMTSE